MAELGKRNTSKAVIIARVALIVLLLYLTAREFMPGTLLPRRVPQAVKSVMTLLEEARESARSTGKPWTVSCSVDENSVSTFPVIEQEGGDEETRKLSLAVPGKYRIVRTSFPNERMEFNAEGSADPGGEIQIQDPWKRPYSIEVSPKSGEVWIIGYELDPYNRVGAWVGALCVVAILSFLYRENQFYRFFEHVLVGIAMGYGTALVLRQNIWDKWWIPMKSGYAQIFGGSYVPLVMAGVVLLLYAGFVVVWIAKHSKSNPLAGIMLIAIPSGIAAVFGLGAIVRGLAVLWGTKIWEVPVWGYVSLAFGILGTGWCVLGPRFYPEGTRAVAMAMCCLLVFGAVVLLGGVLWEESGNAAVHIVMIAAGIVLFTASIGTVGKNPWINASVALLAIVAVFWGLAGFFGPVKIFYTRKSFANVLLVFAGMLGMLWYFQYSKRYLWVSRIVVGVTAGAAAGLGIKNTIIRDWPQITGTFKEVFLRADIAPHMEARTRYLVSFENFLILFIVLCVLYYFFFSFRRQKTIAKAPANLGRMFLMVTLGAFFGNTFLTRVVILIDRVQFLLRDWLLVR